MPTMQSGTPISLTPALSPEGRGWRYPREIATPLPPGEGQGVREFRQRGPSIP